MAKGKVRVGVSACLLGERVRWDGGHKLDPLVVHTLSPDVEWVPVCPEVESGLGVPRPPMRLRRRRGAVRLVVDGGADVTPAVRRFIGPKLAELARLGLHGYVLKSRSPSCGLDVPIQDGERTRRGRGVWAAALIRRFRGVPVVEAEALRDPRLRRAFFARARARARGSAR